jgi:KaiC/GvpD/RAD55 family RecA-like ATPase
MRVFEQSMHGGLGRGGVGVVAAGSGVGKTPLLVQIALDNLLRDRRVLHISHECSVDHARAYYSEIFHDLSVAAQLTAADAVKLELERHRLIFSLRSQSDEGPISARGGRSSVSRILEVVTFAREVAQFEPDVIIVDGLDLAHGTGGAVEVLSALAKELDVELWLSARTEETTAQAGALPEPLDRMASLLDVVVYLSPEPDAVRLCLLKDHDSDKREELHLRLDHHTMRVIDEHLPPKVQRPHGGRRHRLVSGGGKGAEAEFGACAERWGLVEINFSFDGHRSLVRRRGVRVLEDSELEQGDFSLVYASGRLKRKLSEIPQVRRVLQTIWHQVTQARQVFAIGALQPDGTLRGGTGWGAELARLWDKPLYVFDQSKEAWFHWTGSEWHPADQPVISSEVFAGIGTQHLTPKAKEAIVELFRRSFGETAATS